ncbi:hypothetical protein E1301_Tti007410 [Triplophysa tibetana]|uniref:LEM domain-containing protein n=1 Tax=Triplophysa tibetana TaxID=1572043 RepID=A0A5A9NWT2_9TELE|nr:hypothetical protein E1301_Tti007410 [Triplophysa tibetana]
MLSSKSMDEIRWLLDDYGIKHGPVVESTRALYEKKLREAMAKQRKKPQSDRTNYREEAEEVTYVHRDRPAQYDLVSDRTRPDQRWAEYTHEAPIYRAQAYRNMSQSTNSHYDLVSNRWGDYTDEPPIYRSQASNRYMSQSRNLPSESQSKEPSENGSTRLVPLWLKILVFLIVSGVLFLVFINMETADPINRLT